MNIFDVVVFGIVVFVTHFIEGITGFGCTVLALPFCIAISGINVAVPVLGVVAWLLSLYIIVIDFRKIVWREYIRILSLVILGLPIGMWLFTSLPEKILKYILGFFMLIIALRGLYLSYFTHPQEAVKEDNTDCAHGMTVKKCLLSVFLFLGGIIHGAFSSGGPFVVIYAAQALVDKSSFRATLCTLWATLNSVLILNYVRTGVITGDILKLIIWTLPFLTVGMVLGNYAHKRINGEAFSKLVYVVLLLSGAFMLR